MELYVTRQNVIDYLPPRFGLRCQLGRSNSYGILRAAAKIVPFFALAALAAALFLR